MPSKLTPAIQTAICNAVAAGVPLSRASILAGVDPATVNEWIRRGEGVNRRRPASPRFVSFARAVEKAKAQDEARRVARINQAGQGGAVTHRKTVETVDKAGQVTRRIIEEHKAPPDWRADAFHLERTRPEEWGRRDHVDHGVDNNSLAAVLTRIWQRADPTALPVLSSGIPRSGMEFSSRHPVPQWEVNSTLPRRYQLDQHSGPHGAS
jgi:hypothetical protein